MPSVVATTEKADENAGPQGPEDAAHLLFDK